MFRRKKADEPVEPDAATLEPDAPAGPRAQGPWDVSEVTLEVEGDDPQLVATRGANSITSRLRRAIESGVYSDGDQLPPERQLASANICDEEVATLAGTEARYRARGVIRSGRLTSR